MVRWVSACMRIVVCIVARCCITYCSINIGSCVCNRLSYANRPGGVYCPSNGRFFVDSGLLGCFPDGSDVSWIVCVSLWRFVWSVRIGVKPKILARQGPTFCALVAWILKWTSFTVWRMGSFLLVWTRLFFPSWSVPCGTVELQWRS